MKSREGEREEKKREERRGEEEEEEPLQHCFSEAPPLCGAPVW